MDKLLDLDYTPLTQEEISISSKKHKFMCYVLSTTLQTDGGKKIVKEHEDDFHAQMVYKKMVDFKQLQ